MKKIVFLLIALSATGLITGCQSTEEKRVIAKATYQEKLDSVLGESRAFCKELAVFGYIPLDESKPNQMEDWREKKILRKQNPLSLNSDLLAKSENLKSLFDELGSDYTELIADDVVLRQSFRTVEALENSFGSGSCRGYKLYNIERP